MDSHRPSRVCTLFATATWMCRSGSPARLSRWVNAVPTRPRTLTCRMPSGPGEQVMLLDEHQRVLHGSLMRLFDDGRHGRVGYRPQTRDRFHRGECQVVTRDGLRAWPRVLGDLSRQLPGIDRLPAMLGPEKLPFNLSPHPRTVSRRDRGVGRPSDGGVERGDALSHL